MGVGLTEAALRRGRGAGSHDRSDEQDKGQPEVDAKQDGDQDPGAMNAVAVVDGLAERVPHLGSIALLAAVQLAWLLMLGLGLYWLGQRLL